MTGPTSRRSGTLWFAAALVAAGGFVASAQQQPVFRSSVDVIAVDVQVVDPQGNPIGKIGPESFTVSINGQRRKVVSAQFVREMAATQVKGDNGVPFVITSDGTMESSA